ncbi:hypothetical protein CYMTET_12656, partial [Cymbomonas tetramitiformis]
MKALSTFVYLQLFYQGVAFASRTAQCSLPPFYLFDKDQDGYLSQREYENLQARAIEQNEKRVERNNSGYVDTAKTEVVEETYDESKEKLVKLPAVGVNHGYPIHRYDSRRFLLEDTQANTSVSEGGTFTVLSGDCETTDGGQCIQSPNWDGEALYPSLTRCEMQVTESGVLQVLSFSMEPSDATYGCYDFLGVNGLYYCDTAPQGVFVSADSSLFFISDESVQYTGFRICWANVPPPQPPQPPPQPPNPEPPTSPPSPPLPPTPPPLPPPTPA